MSEDKKQGPIVRKLPFEGQPILFSWEVSGNAKRNNIPTVRGVWPDNNPGMRRTHERT